MATTARASTGRQMDDQLPRKVFNHCVRGRFKLLFLRSSLAFYLLTTVHIVIIIMRFTTFVGFMLPLAALAASTSPQPDSADADMLKQLGEAQGRFTAAFIYTSTATNATIDQLSTSQNDLERAILDEVQAATEVFEIAVLATANIVSLNDQAALGFEYVDSLCAYTMVNNELMRRFCSL